MNSHEIHLLTVSEASNLLGLRKSRVYTLIREGILPAIHLGRQIRIDKSALNEWIRAGGKSLPGGWRHWESEQEESNGR